MLHNSSHVQKKPFKTNQGELKAKLDFAQDPDIFSLTLSFCQQETYLSEIIYSVCRQLSAPLWSKM